MGLILLASVVTFLAWGGLVQARGFRERRLLQSLKRALKDTAGGPEPVESAKTGPRASFDEMLSAGECLVTALQAEEKASRSCRNERSPDVCSQWQQARADTDTSLERYNAL